MTKQTRLFNILGSETVRFENLILTGGMVGGGLVEENTGGAVSSRASLVFANCTIGQNGTDGGGGGVHAGGDATLTNCTLIGNVARYWGGGVYAEKILTLENCTVSGNRAGGGAGVFAMGTAMLTNCTIFKNKAYLTGGGVGGEKATLVNCLITENASGAEGCGVAVGELFLENCRIFGNIPSKPKFRDASNIFAGTGVRNRPVLISKGGNTIGTDISGGGVGTFAPDMIVKWLESDQVGPKP